MSEERVPYIAGPQKPEEARFKFVYFEECNTKPDFVGDLSGSEVIDIISKALCRADNIIESCSHCLTQCDKEKQADMCKRILTKKREDIEPSYIEKAETVLDAILMSARRGK